jgi:NAD(P)-dependent dehydrogenase (short-subunit alcohol dehydrogenase family)
VTGDVALVTGGGSGIGEAITRRLASEATEVVVVDVDAERGARVASAVGGRAVAADVADASAWVSIAGELERLNVACLNAGVVTGTSSIVELTDELYRRILGVNVDGVVFGVRALTPLLGRSAGQIVVTASLAGLVPLENDPIYAATKHFLIGFVRSVAPQLAERGVRVNAVCPGIVDTPLLGEAERARLEAAGFPLLSPDDVAEAVVRAIRTDATGQAWACQPGREPVLFRFPNVPGPRTPGAAGVRPPV